jgi:hypothetical protein
MDDRTMQPGQHERGGILANFHNEGRRREAERVAHDPLSGGNVGVPAFEDSIAIRAAKQFMDECGLVPTPDATGQLVEVFLPCLAIMCQRGYDPNGGTWRKSGRLGALSDVRKKFERLWERMWINGKRHDDSAFDLINFTGFLLRSEREGFGEWGTPNLDGLMLEE